VPEPFPAKWAGNFECQEGAILSGQRRSKQAAVCRGGCPAVFASV